MTDSLWDANRSIDAILAYRAAPDRLVKELDRLYGHSDETGRHALFLAVCGRLVVERSRQRASQGLSSSNSA